MAVSKLGGVIAAVITPLDETAAPDTERFVKVARYLLAHGCDGLNVLGTTGEATSFSLEQRLGVMRACLQADLPLDRLMVGTGAAATADAVRLTREAEDLGFAAALVLPPFYYKGVPDEGIVRYIGALVDATSIPIFLYNYPALSGVPYTEALVSALMARFGDRIAGLKDSSGDLPYARAMAALSPHLRVFPSSEAVLLDARAGQFAGCISATANLNSALCGRAFHHGDVAALERAVGIRKLFDGRPLVPGIKVLAAHLHQDRSLAAIAPPFATMGPDDWADAIDRYDELRGEAA